MLQVKVCGLRDNIQEVADLQPDYAGFIFFDKSKRYFEEKEGQLIPDISIPKVGVVVNKSVKQIVELIGCYKLEYIQLHSDEDAWFVIELKQACPEIKVIKVFRVTNELPVDLEHFNGLADMFLFDAKVSEFGGAGVSFDWSILKSDKIKTPFLIAGGIDLDKARALKSFDHPYFKGIDINSKVENAPGLKDIDQVQEIIKEFRDE